MTQTVELPIWLFVVIVLFAAVTFASHFLFPSVRWFFRRRLERAVTRLNERLTVKIQPFKLLRRQDMIQRLVYDPQVTEAIVQHAAENGVREDVAFQIARRYAREIVPSFSAFTYFGFGTRVARWLANLLYDVRTGGEDALGGIDDDATVVFVMNHRSNMDYVLVTYLAAQASALSYAVGEWARVWPLSRLIKMMGAYFIRRKSRGQLYRKVLARYVHMSTAGGVTQAIFPEGGLSLDGRLAPPKLGLLSYVVDAHRETGRKVIFVPVALNYDRVLEDRVLTEAHHAGTRRFRARLSTIFAFVLSKLWLKLTGRFDRFGMAGVVFGAPVPLTDTSDPEALARNLLARIEDVMPVTGVAVLARLLLETPQDGIAQSELMDQAGSIWPQSAPVPTDAAAVPDLLTAALANLKQRGLIVPQQGRLAANPDQTDILRFYANTIAHYFADAEIDAAPAGS
ncbi:MAG: 1-acyl-sn-glycerol-3-phosphate acyltransferase [Pseudomonadota bacterium]